MTQPPAAPGPYYPAPYGPPQVIIKPGGLPGTTHLVHVIVAILTCGLWLPFYLLIFAFSPAKRVEVIAPAGTPQDVIARAHAEALVPTPAERSAAQFRKLVVGVAFAPIAVVLVLVILTAALD